MIILYLFFIKLKAPVRLKYLISESLTLNILSENVMCLSIF